MTSPNSIERKYLGNIDAVFGHRNAPIEEVARRAAEYFYPDPVIVWQGDAATFQFLFVSEGAEVLLGYPVRKWVEEPTFWTDVILHPDDRDHAVAYCALSTGKGQDHDFEYRARTADGRVVLLHDVVRVVFGPKGFATHLRGLMFDVTSRIEEETIDTPRFGHHVRTDIIRSLTEPQGDLSRSQFRYHR
jgi:PAS domain S-box-containing protein